MPLLLHKLYHSHRNCCQEEETPASPPKRTRPVTGTSKQKAVRLSNLLSIAGARTNPLAPCPLPPTGRDAKATEKQKSLYAAQCTRLKTTFAACTKASQVSAILENLPPGSIFQVFATKQPKGIENEGVRGFGYVLGPTLSSTQTLPITLTLTPKNCSNPNPNPNPNHNPNHNHNPNPNPNVYSNSYHRGLQGEYGSATGWVVKGRLYRHQQDPPHQPRGGAGHSIHSGHLTSSQQRGFTAHQRP